MRSLLLFFTIPLMAITLIACGGANGNGSSNSTQTPDSISLGFVGRYSSGHFDKSAAEIPVFDPESQRAFVVNAQQGVVNVLDMSVPETPVYIGSVDANDIAVGAVVNSVAIQDGVIALAIEPATKTDNGFVGFYQADDLSKISHVGVGALPDMLTFTPDGKHVLVANEGEPSDDYSIDPEGSISVIDVTDPPVSG
jgi:DNA-binding beta-propeller fold protein YncE